MTKFMVIVAGLCVIVAYGLVSAPTARAEHYECSVETMTSEEFLECVENRSKNNPKVEDEMKLVELTSNLCLQYARDSINTLMGCAKAHHKAIDRCHQHLPDFDKAFACVDKKIRDRYE